MKPILRRYEEVSGQAVNFHKSRINQELLLVLILEQVIE